MTRASGVATNASYRGAHALVLGARGFIGQWMVRALEARGARVTSHVRPDGRHDQLHNPTSGVSATIAADLLDASSVPALLHRVRPDVVFNLAGYGIDRAERDDAMAERINRDLVAQLVVWAAEERRVSDASHWRGARLVHTGSALELGPQAGSLHEDSVAVPDTLYGRTKLGGTIAIASDPTQRSVSARLFTVYGPGEHAGRLLPTLLGALHDERPVPLTAGRQQRDFTYVGDVVAALAQLGAQTTALPSIVNVATGRLTTVRQFAEIASDVLRLPRGRLDFGALPTRDDETPHGPVDVSRLASLLHWSPATSIADGVAFTRSGDGLAGHGLPAA